MAKIKEKISQHSFEKYLKELLYLVYYGLFASHELLIASFCGIMVQMKEK